MGYHVLSSKFTYGLSRHARSCVLVYDVQMARYAQRVHFATGARVFNSGDEVRCALVRTTITTRCAYRVQTGPILNQNYHTL